MDHDRKEARKRLLCELVEDPLYVPMKEKELAVFLQTAKEEREALKAVMD